MNRVNLSIIVTAVYLVGCASAEPVRTPQYRLGIPDALSIADMRVCIQAGVLAAGWDVEGERGTSILASVETSDGWAKVVIEYRPDAYRILHWKSSPSFHYEDGHVSWRYNGWVDRLDTFLRQSLARAMSEKAAAQVARTASADSGGASVGSGADDVEPIETTQ